MIEGFKFYRLPRCRSQKTRVVKKSIGSEIENYLMREETGVRHTDALDFEITVPTFTGWQTVTYVKGDNNSIWYTVEDARENTRFAGQITFTLSFDPFLTITQGTFAGVEAYWRKLPWASPEAKRGTVLDESNLTESWTSLLSVMMWNASPQGQTPDYKDMLWVEVTTTCSLFGVVNQVDGTIGNIETVDLSTYPEYSVADQSSMNKYGFFAVYDKGKQVPRIQRFEGEDGFPLLEHYKDGDTPKTRNRTEWDAYYPSINDVINNPDQVLGIPTDAILDVSITAWCPYHYIITGSAGDTIPKYPSLTVEENRLFLPYVIRRALLPGDQDEYGFIPQRYGNICMYELGRVGGSIIDRDEWGAHSLTISNDEYVCGEVNLRDANGNVIANIPRDYFEYVPETDAWRLDYRAQTYSDSTGLYTRVDIGQYAPHIITFPEGKLPYVGDAYEQYRIREMSYDRQSLQNTKDQAWMQFGAGVADALVGGGMTMAMGRVGAASQRTEAGRNLATGMSIGGGIVSSAINTWLAVDAAQKEQDLTEARQKGAPGTGYNTGYGISYCDNAFDIGAGFVVMMPSRFNSVLAQAQGEYYGYEAGYVGHESITNQDGYYEGVPRPFTGSFQLPDYWFDRFSEMLINGVRIQVI